MRDDVKTTAIRDYLRKGFSLVPLKAIPPEPGEKKWKKKPYVEWKNRQNERPSEATILAEFDKYPDALIGCVTGQISGICTLDIDDDEGKKIADQLVSDSLDVPTFETMSGGQQMVFKNPDPSIKGKVRFLPGLDYRGEGSLAILPPSTNGNGGQYSWVDGLSILNFDPPPLPDAIIYKLINNAYKSITPTGLSDLTAPYSTLPFLTEGRRDEDLFHVANCLVKGSCEPSNIHHIIDILARNASPPFPINEIQHKVASALKRAECRERNLRKEFLDWVTLQEGYWSLTEAKRTLQLITKEKNSLDVIVHRLKKEGKIEKYGDKAGIYRTVHAESEPIDFLNCDVSPLAIRYPFGIENYIKTLPKNIIVVAGSPDAGKTAFLLNLARMNQDRFNVHYFSSEMGPMEMRERLVKFNHPIESWKVKMWEKSSDFSDAVRPDDFNIIDFMEVHTDFWLVGAMIKAVYDKLNRGIAVIAIQKPSGRDEGLGGQRSLEKPRLYLAMESGRIKIVKAKNWAVPNQNPNGLVLHFKIIGGCQLVITEDWRKEN